VSVDKDESRINNGTIFHFFFILPPSVRLDPLKNTVLGKTATGLLEIIFPRWALGFA
jgi:hypothetical protein